MKRVMLTLGLLIASQAFCLDSLAVLRTPRQQISVLAEQCGWKLPAALRAAFHAKHGKSPAAWRAELDSN